VPLQPVDWGERQPRCGEDRPRPHRNDDGIARDELAIDDKAVDAALSPDDFGNVPEAEFGAVRPCRGHHCLGKARRVNLRRGLGRAELPGHAGAGGQPAEVVAAAAPPEPVSPASNAAIGCQPAIAPVAPGLLREFGMHREAAAGESGERGPVAPVEGQKPARLARRRAPDRGALDDGRGNPPAAQKVGDRGADHAAAANQNPHNPPNSSVKKGHMDSALTIGQDARGVGTAVGKPP
jgi:hypothetical protein